MNAKAQMIAFLIALVPYSLVCWGYVAVTDGGSSEYWRAMALLLAGRVLFAALDASGSALHWKLYARPKTIAALVGKLQEGSFPERNFGEDDFSTYMARIESDASQPIERRMQAREWRTTLFLQEHNSLLAGLRLRSAAEAALRRYASDVPRRSLIM